MTYEDVRIIAMENQGTHVDVIVQNEDGYVFPIGFAPLAFRNWRSAWHTSGSPSRIGFNRKTSVTLPHPKAGLH